MHIIRREFYDLNWKSELRIIPIGDVHIGARACDEQLLKKTVAYIKSSGAYWIGLGDYCDFINISDPRFNAAVLADWVNMIHLRDLVRAQKERFIEAISPIADRCLGMVCGNHESAILRHYERDVHSEIITEIKHLGGFEPDYKLSLGMYGWVQIVLYRSSKKKKHSAKLVNVNVHHGFTGGRLAGAKALNMQRWLWTRNADVAIFGHSHNTAVQSEAVEEIDRSGKVKLRTRKGCYSGTFLRTGTPGTSTYNEAKGYLPLPVGGVEIVIRMSEKDVKIIS